jgi:tight adherence protein B
MSGLSEYLFYAFLVVAVLLFVDGASRLWTSFSKRQDAQRRLGARPEDPNRAAAIRRINQASSSGPLGYASSNLGKLYVQAGSPMNPTTFFVMLGVLAVAVFALVLATVGSVTLGLICALVAAAVIPYFALVILREQRQATLVAQLPDALDTMVRSLRAGHPLTAAIGLVGRDAPQPLSSEFGAAATEMTLGLDLESSIKNMARRVGAPETDIFAVVVAIQQRSGGNLVEIMQRLAVLLRERARMRAKAKALSSEGRWTALILCALPFVMMGILLIINPRYYGDFASNPIIVPTFVGTFIWMMIGMVLIQRMVNFRV